MPHTDNGTQISAVIGFVGVYATAIAGGYFDLQLPVNGAHR